MKLEDQVVSLELAKKLKELGVKQKSLFYWSYYDDGNSKDAPAIAFTDDCNLSFMEDLVSAFTVAELGEMLPDGIESKIGASNGFQCRRGLTGHVVYWWDYEADTYRHYTHAVTEADARAKMLIYLIENNLITI